MIIILKLVHPQPGERLLDLGCGSGALTRRLARKVLPLYNLVDKVLDCSFLKEKYGAFLIASGQKLL